MYKSYTTPPSPGESVRGTQSISAAIIGEDPWTIPAEAAWGLAPMDAHDLHTAAKMATAKTFITIFGLSADAHETITQALEDVGYTPEDDLGLLEVLVRDALTSQLGHAALTTAD